MSEIKVSQLNEIAEQTGLADNYYSLRFAEDLDLSPKQAFALAWYAIYEAQPDMLKIMNLPATKIAVVELLGISRPTLDKWLNDEQLAVSGVQRLIDSRLPGLLFKSFNRIEQIIVSGNDAAANTSIKTILDYYAARQTGSTPGVQVNIDQREQTANINLSDLPDEELNQLAEIAGRLHSVAA